MANGYLVSGAEVGTKHVTYLEEQIVSKDVGEDSCHIGMVLVLAKAGFDVIGMDDNVVIGVQDP